MFLGSDSFAAGQEIIADVDSACHGVKGITDSPRDVFLVGKIKSFKGRLVVLRVADIGWSTVHHGELDGLPQLRIVGILWWNIILCTEGVTVLRIISSKRVAHCAFRAHLMAARPLVDDVAASFPGVPVAPSERLILFGAAKAGGHIGNVFIVI